MDNGAHRVPIRSFLGDALSVRSALVKRVNTALAPLNVQIIYGTTPDPAVKTYLSARRTIREARNAGLSVGAYLDREHAEPGSTPEAVQAMIKIGGLTADCDVVCEIGPGSGRFAVEVIQALHPGTYEIYETAKDWLPTLRQLPGAVVRPADGHTLSATPDASVDLVHSQRTFSYLPPYVGIGYMAEMARVVKPGGVVAFDAVTDPCLDDRTAQLWAEVGTVHHMLSRDWVLQFLGRRGLELAGSHFTPLPPGTAELMVFRRA
jgi:SAM-dependent methyltransferase